MARKLSDIVRTPAFERAVDRARAKLDAEEAGWFVMEPKRARALLAVARSSAGVLALGDDHDSAEAFKRWSQLRRAHARLERVSKPRAAASESRERAMREVVKRARLLAVRLHLVPCPCQDRFAYQPGNVNDHHPTCDLEKLRAALAALSGPSPAPSGDANRKEEP